jgi:hypothetical protein
MLERASTFLNSDLGQIFAGLVVAIMTIGSMC